MILWKENNHTLTFTWTSKLGIVKELKILSLFLIALSVEFYQILNYFPAEVNFLSLKLTAVISAVYVSLRIVSSEYLCQWTFNRNDSCLIAEYRGLIWHNHYTYPLEEIKTVKAVCINKDETEVVIYNISNQQLLICKVLTKEAENCDQRIIDFLKVP
jgi:hypothetical protein